MSEQAETVRELELSDTELEEVSGGMWYMFATQAVVLMGYLGATYYHQGVKDLS